MADASTKVSATTQITHIGSGGSVATAAFNSSADISTALSFTGNLNRYPRCDVVITVATSASIAAASNSLHLYRRDINVDGTTDETVPGTSNRAHYVRSFTIPAATTASVTNTVHLEDIPLPGGSDCEFYIENSMAVSMLIGWTMKITPKTDVGATA